MTLGLKATISAVAETDLMAYRQARSMKAGLGLDRHQGSFNNRTIGLGRTLLISGYPGRDFHQALWQRLKARRRFLAGYVDTNEAERLAQEPAMRFILGWRGPKKPAASTNTVSRFGTEVLTRPENLKGLVRLNARLVRQ